MRDPNVPLDLSFGPVTMLAVDAIAAILTTRVVGKPLAWEQRVDSTNDRLKQLAPAGATSGAVLGAEYQLSGKGRFNRSWISTEGENILVSVLLRSHHAAPTISVV